MADSRKRKKRKTTRKPAKKKSTSLRRRNYLLAAGSLVLACLVWVGILFERETSWAVAALEQDLPGAPVTVYAAPRILRPGEPRRLAALYEELLATGYRRETRMPAAPGSFQELGDGFALYRRAWLSAHGPVPAEWMRAVVRSGVVRSLTDSHGRRLEAFTVEPAPLGAFQGDLLQQREPLLLAAFPERVVDAVLAAEDRRFFEHGGLDPRGILRAAWQDLTGGGPLQGGSTITQQVIKNRLLGHRRSIGRKLREALLAPWVEWRVGKERILEIYLNEVYMGQRGAVSVLGIPAAAEHYFGKEVVDLSLDETALLAGMISSPGRYHPRHHPERARARRDRILDAMAELEMIAGVEREAAGARPVTVVDVGDPLDPAGDVLDAVQRELAGRGWDPRPGREPRQVMTTIEVPVQRAARDALEETLRELEAASPGRKPLEGAVLVLRPATGAVAALVGGRHGTRGEFNRALDAKRQPGSAFKPFVALAAVSELGWSPAHPLEDAPLEVREGGKPWRPENVDRKFRGTVTLRQALEDSLNVPMARAGLAVGPQRVAKAARKAGMTADLPRTPALALGVGEVSPLDLARGYATLASRGRRVPPFLVHSVAIGGGVGAETLPIEPLAPAIRVFDEVDAWLVLDALAGVVQRGTGRALAPVTGGLRVAAKTGTSQNGRDGWFVLASPRAVVVAWVGRDDGRPAGLSGPRSALPVVRRMLSDCPGELLAPLPDPPEGVDVVYLDEEDACAWDEPRDGARREVFRAGEAPARCRKSFWRRLFD